MSHYMDAITYGWQTLFLEFKTMVS
jgi:hypothetical protein